MSWRRVESWWKPMRRGGKPRHSAYLMADKESLSLIILLPCGNTEDNLPKRADGLFELCNKVFEHVEAMLRKEEDEEVDAAEGGDKRVAKTLLNSIQHPLYVDNPN
ncbi:uncharacterized protein LOC127850574 isoform X2 [Dreissena polymorpha]|nr:uncharacterized protein LOC127850574 isoform X2 [Dreissena polymorpha]